ncbi:MAG: hypothetical protein BSK19_07590 [Stenotrophomonas maltophilia]|nr:MAG: hypothetical protein BSK19_07590 [Stenotrophomonas maltophilia]
MALSMRDRGLLDLAYRTQRTLPISGVCMGRCGEPCHSNEYRHSRGSSIKTYDWFFANGCRSCRREQDQGKRFTREGRVDIWQRVRVLTMLQLWKRSHRAVRE